VGYFSFSLSSMFPCSYWWRHNLYLAQTQWFFFWDLLSVLQELWGCHKVQRSKFRARLLWLFYQYVLHAQLLHFLPQLYVRSAEGRDVLFNHQWSHQIKKQVTVAPPTYSVIRLLRLLVILQVNQCCVHCSWSLFISLNVICFKLFKICCLYIFVCNCPLLIF